ncbi:hypothetical protein BDR05DRAFT_958224 [Suillus weaverae]|nr:hypothetical protein BDR05DRAFT_958224 [Suillus weaverae]
MIDEPPRQNPPKLPATIKYRLLSTFKVGAVINPPQRKSKRKIYQDFKEEVCLRFVLKPLSTAHGR